MKHRTSSRARSVLRLAPAIIAAGSLMLGSVQSGWAADSAAAGYSATAAAAPSAAPPTQSPQSTPRQLDQLVAPIALYPDELVAEVLAAATYPTDVVEADRWIQTHASLKGNDLADEVNAQPWADSVKALAQFPSVLAMMDKNLAWTSSLGEAYVSGSQSVMSAIQQMRARAQRAGNLESTPQERVTNEGPTIVIQPATPEVVYVPEYDPWLVYGAPAVFYPGWVSVPGLFIGEPGISFGLGIGIGLFGGFGWGWHHWRPDWDHHDIFFNHHPYTPRHPALLGRQAPGAFDHPGAFGRAGAFRDGVGLTRGLPRGAIPGARTGGFAYGAHHATHGALDHGAAVERLSSHGRASFGEFRGRGFAGVRGGARFGGSHGGGGHR